MPTTIHVEAILLDMDGTLVDSTAAVVGAWEVFADKYPEIDIQKILNDSHGVRTMDNLRKHCGIQDSEQLQKEVELFEQAIIDSSRKNGRHGITRLPGAKQIVEVLSSSGCKWAICTSATRKYASAALSEAGIPIPDVFVTAEDVKQGKPMPDPYLLAAERCGVIPEKCLVVEDAPSGIISGQRAGCRTVGLRTSHSREKMEPCQPDFLVENLSRLSVRILDELIEVTINPD